MGTEELDDILEHYGIKGMKWGVRRTDAQLARARGKRKKKERVVSPDAKRVEERQQKIKKEGIRALSDAELKDLNKRLNMEKQYRDLTKEQRSKLSKEDKEMITAIINGASNMTLAATGGSAAASAVGTAIQFAGRAASNRSQPKPTIEVLETVRN